MNMARISACAGALLLMGLLFGVDAATAQTGPSAPKKPRGYLPVEDVPKRAEPSLSPDDRARIVKELSAARDRQAPRKPAEAAKPAKP
jgi:hypothetical protein